jgi:hypothetical protein
VRQTNRLHDLGDGIQDPQTDPIVSSCLFRASIGGQNTAVMALRS